MNISEADIDSETELNPMHEPLNRPILPPISVIISMAMPIMISNSVFYLNLIIWRK